MAPRYRTKLFVSVLFSAVAMASVAEAGGIAGLARNNPVASKPMREGSNVAAPFAFIRYCVRSPNYCKSDGPSTLEWSPPNKALLVRVNQKVNAFIQPRNDRGDEWRGDVKSGDCEDFALTKRQALLDVGIPASALRMAVARTSLGEGHAVLVVSTSEGDLVLDNRYNALLPWHKTDLRPIKIASAENPLLWRRLVSS